MEVAIDACVFVALINPHDIWHIQAKTLIDTLRLADIKPTNFDCAVTEAASVLVRRLHEKRRGHEVPMVLEQLDGYIPPQLIIWILPEVPRLYADVLNLMQTSNGELNFNDALIALACRERGITLIASFDPDFDRVPWLKRVAEPTDVEAARK